MEDFDRALADCLPALERFVKFKISNRFDAEDIIQDSLVAAVSKKDSLRDPLSLKAWLIRIAQNRCTDYYRAKAKQMEIPIEALSETVVSTGLCGRRVDLAVGETLDRLGDREKQILYLYYFKELPQDQIAARLGVPLGTVKSRLHYAKKKFKESYPFHRGTEGGENMKKLPNIMPDYTIEWTDKEPFPLRWEEIMGWFIVPRLGEKLSWAMYDFPERERTELCELEVIGRAEVHGLEGVEIRSIETDPMECNSAGGQQRVERHLIAQLTDTHCRLLAHSVTEGGVRRYSTFLDGDSFLNNWGFGEDNCGNEVNLIPKGDVVREGNVITTAHKKFLLDVVGRCSVTIGGKSFDTVCVMDCETYDEGVVSEQYLDKNGRTVLWRRFNSDAWQFERYGKRWTELLPDNERITVNGETCVHWYDCITEYIM
ncbi:MAG: RNA polymerase sigma factor [Oscillospiraceae bacterium]|nr:RNA polymerase sigma factor [Oscillospiraceae bacterium]